MKRGRALLATVMVFVVALSVAAPAIAATSNDPVTDHLTMGDWDEEETAPNPVINGTVTTAAQDLAEGRTAADIAGYEDDNGDWVAGSETPFVVNESFDIDSGLNANPYTFRPGHIEDSSYTAFPDKEDETWNNASDWTVYTNSGNVTLSNTTVAQGVEGVRFDSTSDQSGVTDGGTIFEARFNSWDGELDSDENKRVLQFAADVDTLQANAQVQVRIYDESGDYKNFTIDPDNTFGDSNPAVLGAGTNDYVKQVKLSDVSTTGGGSWDNIENVTVRLVAEGGTTSQADFTISWLDLRKKAPNKLGESRATTDDDGNDGDSDGEYDEFQTIENATNTVSVHSMTTLGNEYDDAVVHDLEYPARFQADGLDLSGEEGDYIIHWDDAQNPGYDAALNVTYRLTLPNEVDLSYSNMDVNMTQKWPEARYLTLESASAVSDSTNLTGEPTFTSQAGSLATAGTHIELVGSSVDAGENFLVHYEVELTADERSALEATGAGAAAPAQEGGGGLGDMVVGFFTSTLGIVLTALTGVVIWLRRRG